MSLYNAISNLFTPTMRWDIRTGSITGPVRQHNEDSVTSSQSDQSAIAVLADGVGGHNAGEIASKFVCDALTTWFEGHAPSESLAEEMTALEHAVETVHGDLFNLSLEKKKRKGMATTLAMVLQHGRSAILAWAGDSRIYRVHRGGITQLSKDHSFVEEKFREGIFTREDVEQHPMGNVITSCLGANESMPHLGLEKIILRKGDQLLIVSDGVSDVLDEQQILAAMTEGVEGVLDAALQAFSNDNCSAVIVEVV